MSEHPIADCSDCGRKYLKVDESPMCARCRPLEDTTGPSWLPERYVLRLSSFEVGMLIAAMLKRCEEDDDGPLLPAALRLQRKLDELGRQIYDESHPKEGT